MSSATLARVLRKIHDGTLSRGAAAEALDCSERQVNRLMELHGVRRPVSPQHAEREAARKRREAKQKAAERVIEGKSYTAEAAKADVSVRTLYRWVQKTKKMHRKGRK